MVTDAQLIARLDAREQVRVRSASMRDKGNSMEGNLTGYRWSPEGAFFKFVDDSGDIWSVQSWQLTLLGESEEDRRERLTTSVGTQALRRFIARHIQVTEDWDSDRGFWDKVDDVYNGLARSNMRPVEIEPDASAHEDYKLPSEHDYPNQLDDSCAAEDPTEHLLASPVNAARLRESIAEASAWRVAPDDALSRRMDQLADEAVIDSRNPGPFSVTITYPPVSAPLYETLTFDEDTTPLDEVAESFGVDLDDDDCEDGNEFHMADNFEHVLIDGDSSVVVDHEDATITIVEDGHSGTWLNLPKDKLDMIQLLAHIAHAGGFDVDSLKISPTAPDPYLAITQQVSEVDRLVAQRAGYGEIHVKLTDIRAKLSDLKEQNCD